jgi:hypothetical protein
MRLRATIGAIALAAIWVVQAGGGPAPALAATTCSWGGTALAPTGKVTISPGLTNTPAAEPLEFEATGVLVGARPCNGQMMTFMGQIDAGSTCLEASFEGTVKGVPGVARFWGEGNAVVHEFLYDKAGNIVGADQPAVAPPPADVPAYINCNTPEGITSAGFTSLVELFE